MKKVLYLTLLLGLLLASCTKEEDAVIGGTYGNFKVETMTKFDHKFPHRGMEPLVINNQKFTFSGKNSQGEGLIATNYGDIPLKFPYKQGLKVSTKLYTELLTYDDPFFLHGGYIILYFSLDDEPVFKTDSIQYDIIAPNEVIEEWAHKGRK